MSLMRGGGIRVCLGWDVDSCPGQQEGMQRVDPGEGRCGLVRFLNRMQSRIPQPNLRLVEMGAEMAVGDSGPGSWHGGGVSSQQGPVFPSAMLIGAAAGVRQMRRQPLRCSREGAEVQPSARSCSRH